MQGKRDQHLSLQYTVIDEQVVRQAVEHEQALDAKSKQEVSGRSNNQDTRIIPVPHHEEVRFEEVETLRLSYQNILRIDNLVGLRALTTLCLDNNVIEEIENLGHLVNLTWLDLSFNNIKKIQGLENLIHLKDLSLYSNNIEVIENLEQCKNLECLSIGKNKINKLENLLYLRQFQKLRLVTLDGNPVCKDPEYRMYVLAYLENLKYLDYALVEKREVISAREQYQDELLEAQERETLEDANRKAAEQHAEYLEKLKLAHLEISETLFSDMFGEDKELPKLKLLPGFDTIYDSYQHEFRAQAEQTINAGLEIHARFTKENEKVEQAIEKVTRANETMSIELVENFNKAKKHIQQAINEFVKSKRAESAQNNGQVEGKSMDDIQDELIAKLEDLENARLELRENLMTIEVQQVQQLRKLTDVYENRAGAIRSERSDHTTQFFRAVEDLENSFATALEDLAQGLMEKLANNVLEDLSDEAVAFLSDRDNLMVAIQGSHDVHLGKLLAQEDAMRESISRDLNNRVKNMKKDFNQRNRDRVFEIGKMHDDARQQIVRLSQEVMGADEDEGF